MTPLLVEATNAMRREYQEKFEEQDRLISNQQSEIEILKDRIARLEQMILAQSETIDSED